MDAQKVFEAVVVLFFIALILERAMAVLFEWRIWKNHFNNMGLKTPVAVLASWGICSVYQFDFFSMAFGEESHRIGVIITALFVAGGSKVVMGAIQKMLEAKKEISG